MMAGSALAGRDFVAVHMAWGAINEWTTQAGYAQLARRAGHPVLSELLKRIMRQEGRHIDFYASQAERRLAASRRARRLTRFALRTFWSPVGSGVMPPAETHHWPATSWAADDGLEAARRIDRRVDRLPGLAGLAVAGRVDPLRASQPERTFPAHSPRNRCLAPSKRHASRRTGSSPLWCCSGRCPTSPYWGGYGHRGRQALPGGGCVSGLGSPACASRFSASTRPDRRCRR